MKRLSIIIVTYKSEHDIYDCLKTVWDYCDIPKDELEVIIVDNSPECEPMFSKLRTLYGNDITLIHNTHNGGYGQGNNIGIREAKAPIILIMNPDVRLFEPIGKIAVEAFEKDKKLSIYGMKQMQSATEMSPTSFFCSYMMNGYLFTILTGLCNRFDLYLPKYMYFSGSCFFIRKDMFESIGLFDESIFMYGEEDDVRWRMMEKFGSHFKYNKHLHYIHPMLDRPPNINYEKKLLEVAMTQNEKKGYSRKKTLRNRMQNFRMLILRERLRKCFGKANLARLAMYEDFYGFMKEQNCML